MNNSNLDDWLASLGITDSEETIRDDAPQNAAPPEEEINTSPFPSLPSAVPQVEEAPSASLSEEDFNSILADNGIPISQEADAEEIEEVLFIEEEEDSSSIETPTESTEPELVAYYDYSEGIPVNTNSSSSEPATVPSASPEGQEPLLPQNSPTLLMNTATSRFSGTEWYNEIQKAKIIFAGCGGIGSNAAFQIARMAPAALYLYDDDRVEMVNMSGQLFGYDDVGKAKVNAVADMIHSYTSMHNTFAIEEKFTPGTHAGDIMMCGFDSMEARRTFFNAWHEHVRVKTVEERKRCLFLDGRLSIDVLQVFCITGDDTYNIDRYCKEFLFSDAEAEQTVCSLKQTTYLACMIGSLMTNIFTNFVANSLNPVIPYHLPFFTEYDAKHMIFKTEN